LAGGKALLRDGRGYAAEYGPGLSLRGSTHATERVLHQRIYFVRSTNLEKTASRRLTEGHSWFVIGQLFGSVALKSMRDTDPNDFRTPIYTQASWSDVVYLPELTHLQWAMVGVMGIIFCLLPETPWWLVQKNRASDAAKVLRKYNGHVEGYNVQ
jgi:hypothetical protein